MKSVSHNYYKNRIQALTVDEQKANHRVITFAWVRGLAFVGFVITSIWLANAREMPLLLGLLFLFIPVFGTIVSFHNKFKFELHLLNALIAINKKELNLLDGNFNGLETGSLDQANQHPYAPDLDVLGENSLFQLLNRSQAQGTQEMIKGWLLDTANASQIKERQAAVQALTKDTHWRQKITAYSYGHNKKGKKHINVSRIVQLLNSQLNIVDNLFWKGIAFVMPVVSIVILIGIIALGWKTNWIYLPILINALLLGLLFKPLIFLTKELEQIAAFLKGHEQSFRAMEEKKFETDLLIDLQSNLLKPKASEGIKSLRRTLHFLLNRTNMLYIPLNVLFLLDVQSLLMALSWQKKYLNQMEGWFSAIHTIEALSDMASYAFSNPTYIYPTLAEDPHCLEVQNMGHPLIHSSERVCNDFDLIGAGKLGLVTGSNMSGKSTFLRTIGVNLVLAQMGAPVCAEQFKFSIVRIFTSMRTQDNLKENVSSFYAELRRIKQLLDHIEGEIPIFYMLDEILKGTNSEDRHKGAISLIDKLTHQDCRGLISTHDIQLASLAKDTSNIQNFSFNSRIEADEIIFDYKLSSFACNSFNASQLMRKMGIL